MSVDYELYYPYINTEVTSFYFGIIEEAICIRGDNVIKIEKLRRNKCNREKYIIVSSLFDAIRAKWCGYKECIFWMQGVVPEESYARHHSWIRKKILDFVEKITLASSDKLILVSHEMKKHLSHKHSCALPECFIMPCFNEELDEKHMLYPKEYISNSFVYVGGLSKWQCFDEIVRIYSFIERNVENTELVVFTKQTDEAKKIIKQYEIKNSRVSYAAVSELAEKIRGLKFGFVIREDIILNQVATPTKLSNYLANGIMPIYSGCLKNFSEEMDKCPYAIKLDSIYDEKEIMEKIIRNGLMENVDRQAVMQEYKRVFEIYYCKEKYINLLKEFI